MSIEEHVQLFLQGVAAWNGRIQEEADVGDFVRKDLSDAEISAGLLGSSDFSESRHYPRADLSHCNLRGTNFSLLDLSEADLSHSDLRGADLTSCILAGTIFDDADLENANLSETTLQRSHLRTANLVGTNLTNACPWQANLFGTLPTIPKLGQPTRTSVTCVADLMDICAALPPDRDLTGHPYKLYYRGEPKDWPLRPSMMRPGSPKQNEAEMLIDLMTRRPEDFNGMSSALSQWVLARHHGLQTRLLDVTRNPLVALFFACEEYRTTEGRLHLFAVLNNRIKPYSSDSISVIANFAKLADAEKDLLLGKPVDQPGHGRVGHMSRYSYAMGKLYHLIGQEKPHFQRAIDPKDLFRVFVVEPQQSVPRLRAQAGAFLISAFHERFEKTEIQSWNPLIPAYEHFTCSIPADSKRRILEELRQLNITREDLFPSLDETAKAVIAEYTGGRGENQGEDSGVTHQAIPAPFRPQWPQPPTSPWSHN